MKKKIVAILLAITLCFSISLTGCRVDNSDSGKKETSKNGSSNELKNVKISAINAISWAPVFVAKTEGFYGKEGLNVEFTTPGGPKGFQAMHAGDCDFAMLSQEPLLIAQEKGMESKVIASTLKTRVYGLVSSSEIKDIKGLKGKKVFASDPGSAPYIFTSNVLSMEGIDPLKDVSYVQFSDQNAGLQAFLKGEVDGSFVNMYTLASAKDFKYNVLADTTKSGQSEKYLGSKDFPGEMLCTTKKFSDENPEICQKVVNSMINAQKWIADHSDQEVAKSLKSIFGEIDEDIIAEQVKLVRNEFNKSCKVSKDGQKAVVDMAIKAGIISKEIPYDEIIDMKYVNSYK